MFVTITKRLYATKRQIIRLTYEKDTKNVFL